MNKRINDIEFLSKHFEKSSEFIEKRFSAKFDFAFAAGSGMSEIANSFTVIDELDYEEIPNFPISSVAGHHSKLKYLSCNDKNILYFAGRCHLYEGYSPAETLFAEYVSKELSIPNIIITNAAGGLNPLYKAGDIMLIRDTINLFFRNIHFGSSYNGKNLADSFSKKLSTNGIEHQIGTLAAVTGANYETPAEIRAFRKLGADAAGMSTVLEMQAAMQFGINVIGISLISNELKDTSTIKLNHNDIVEAVKLGESKLIKTIQAMSEFV